MSAGSFQQTLLDKFRLVNEHGELVARHAIDQYFSLEGERYTGSQFEVLIDVDHPDLITERDLVAVTALSVQVPVRASIWLLNREGQTAVSRCLSRVRPDMNIWDTDAAEVLEPGGAMHELWDILGRAHWPTQKIGNGLGGRTKRSKLLAAKRPGLIPITDRVVRAALPPVADYWTAFRDALSARSVRDEISEATSNAPEGVSLLRRIDAAIWTMAHRVEPR